MWHIFTTLKRKRIMYNKTTLIEEGMKLLKFRDDGSAGFDSLESDLQGTEGPFVNDFAGVTLENIMEGMPLSASHERLTTVDAFLRPLLENSIISTVDNFLRKSKDKFYSRDIIRDLKAVSKPAPFKNSSTEILDGRFLGFRIEPKDSLGLAITITGLAVQATEEQTVRVYLYSSDTKQCINYWDVVVSETYDQVWADVENYMVSYSKTHDGVTFLLGVYEQSIDYPQDYYLTSTPMVADFFGCNQDAATIKNLRFAKIAPIIIEATELTYDETSEEYLLPGDWTGDFNQYDNPSWRSLAFKMSVKCDLTTILVAHLAVLQEGFITMAASKIMWALYASPVISPRHEKMRGDYSSFAVKYERLLKGSASDGTWVKGILDGIALDLSGLDSRCLPNDKSVPFIGNLHSR